MSTTAGLQRLTPAQAMEIAGPNARRIGVCDPVGRFVGFEVLDASDCVVARFNAEGQQVDQILPGSEDIPLPPRVLHDFAP
jgi:hypothetical protein